MRRSDFKIGLLFFSISLGIKLPYLGTFLTIDERRWIQGAGQFLLALHSGDLAETYWHFFPGITITWGGAGILWLQSLGATNTTLAEFVKFQTEHLNLSIGAMRLPGVLLTSLALPFIYAFTKPLLGKWAAILGTGLLAIDPFWVAHSRIVNGDALTGILMLASFLCFALLLIKPNQKWAIISGVFAGLSFLTKLPAPLLAPCILTLAIIGYFKHRNWQFWLKMLTWWGLSSVIIFIALWPAMWIAPVETLTLMVKDTFAVGDIGGKDKVEFFMGQVRAQQSQFFYPLALLFRLTPINLIGAILTLGFIITSKQKQIKQTTLLLWLFIIIILILGNVSPKKADRYLMPIPVTINILAGVGWVWLIEQINHWRKTNNKNLKFKTFELLAVILIGGQLFFVIINYPYVLTYYNPLLGGYAKAAELIPVGRGEGLEKAVAWINTQSADQTTTISPYYRNVSNAYLNGKSLGFSDTGETQLLADYVIFYITQTQRKLPYPGVVDYFQQKTPVYVLNYAGTPYVWVYKKERPIKKLAGKAEIVGRARIVGYHISEANLIQGNTTEIILYFLTQNQNLPDNEDFKVSLVDINGNRHGIWNSSTENQWQPASIIEWQGNLSLPKDLPPADYKLKVSLIDTNINAEVTFFPIEDEILTVK